MLVLTRRSGESLHIDGNIKVTIVKISGNRVRVGIEAPENVRVVRGELGDLHELSPADFKEEGAEFQTRSESLAASA